MYEEKQTGEKKKVKATAIYRFYEDSTEEEKNKWVEDTFNEDALPDSDYEARYGFTRSGAWKWVAKWQAKNMAKSMAVKYDIHSGSGFTPKKCTIQINAATYDEYMKKATQIANETGYTKYYCNDAIIRAGIEALS